MRYTPTASIDMREITLGGEKPLLGRPTIPTSSFVVVLGYSTAMGIQGTQIVLCKTVTRIGGVTKQASSFSIVLQNPTAEVEVKSALSQFARVGIVDHERIRRGSQSRAGTNKGTAVRHQFSSGVGVQMLYEASL